MSLNGFGGFSPQKPPALLGVSPNGMVTDF